MQKSIESFFKKSNETSFSEGFVPANRNQIEGTVNNASVNNSDLTENSSTPSVKKRYRPDKDFEFPKSWIGKRERSCQHIHHIPWPHYDMEKDCVFCFYCQNHEHKLTA